MTNEERFYVIEISKDDFGHEYEALFEVCSNKEYADKVAKRRNEWSQNEDENEYYIVVNSEDW